MSQPIIFNCTGCGQRHVVKVWTDPCSLYRCHCGTTNQHPAYAQPDPFVPIHERDISERLSIAMMSYKHTSVPYGLLEDAQQEIKRLRQKLRKHALRDYGMNLDPDDLPRQLREDSARITKMEAALRKAIGYKP